MNFLKIIPLSIYVFASTVCAQSASEKSKPEKPPGATTSATKIFEIIDGNSRVVGLPGSTSDDARKEWSKACVDWKTETKGLNRKNEILAISCEEPNCAYQENGSYTCTSTGTYKLKTEGKLAPPPVAAVETKTEMVVQTPPPQPVFEFTPAPQPGFVWVNGYWGWQGMRHVWYPGHWVAARPGYIWVGDEWTHRGSGWHFHAGHWGRR